MRTVAAGAGSAGAGGRGGGVAHKLPGGSGIFGGNKPALGSGVPSAPQGFDFVFHRVGVPGDKLEGSGGGRSEGSGNHGVKIGCEVV